MRRDHDQVEAVVFCNAQQFRADVVCGAAGFVQRRRNWPRCVTGAATAGKLWLG